MGVYGGAFDPPHLAHAALAQAAIQQHALDHLVILPTGQAWHKRRELSAAAHRLAMARLAFGDIAAANIDDREIRRSGPTYTVDSLEELQREHAGAQLYLLLGQDQLDAFAGWHRSQDILKIATLLVALRADSERADHLNRGKDWAAIPSKISYIPIEMPSMAVSASAIRALSATADIQADHLEKLVNPLVARYIAEHHLYRPT